MKFSGFSKYMKLYLKCILSHKSYMFLESMSAHPFKNESLILSAKDLYYLVLHVKLSTLLYSTQLADIFSYEVSKGNYTQNLNRDFLYKFQEPSSRGNLKYISNYRGTMLVVVYNFHIINSQERLYVFISESTSLLSKTDLLFKSSKVTSITELFFAANWLERELSELSGVIIRDKKDLRNLMLQYGDSSAPFQKSFPTIGLIEMFYNPIKDTLVQKPTSLQL